MRIRRLTPAFAMRIVASSISRLCVAGSRRKWIAAANSSGNSSSDSIGVKMKARVNGVGRGLPKITM